MIGPMRSILLAAILLSASLSSAHAEADHAAIARDALTQVIRPGYDASAATSSVLKDKTDALCAAPSVAAFEAVRDAFAATVESWSRVEIFRFGPVNRDHRYESVFFWPDPKGIGMRQVRRALFEKDETVLQPETLAKKSVALQGLPALEYLLYGEGAEALAAGEDAAFRCRFAASIAANVANIAESVKQDWSASGAFTKEFLEPGPNDPLYRAPKDVTLELFKAFTGGIELVRDQKLGKPLGELAERARPRLAAFWRSGLSFSNMTGNLQAVRALFAKGGFAGVVASQSPGVEDSVLFDLTHAIGVLGAIDQPLAEAVRDSATRGKLIALRVALKSARDTAGKLIAEGADLSFGFNAMDGD